MNKQISYSKIIAGTMTWGEWGKNYSTKEMVALMNHCLEIGITTFDHADIYGDYTNEEAFGKAFAESGIERSSIELISKCGISRVCDQRNYEIHHYNYTRNYIVESVEKSLENLHTDYLDALLLHRPSPLMDPVEISKAVDHLKKSGMIKSFGVSNFTPSQLNMIDSKAAVAVNQIEISLDSYMSMYNGQLDQCIDKGIIPMSWSPLGRTLKGDRLEVLKVVQKMADKYSAQPSQILLAWVLKHPSGIIPVVGTTQAERLSVLMEATQIDLDLEDWFELLQATRGHQIE